VTGWHRLAPMTPGGSSRRTCRRRGGPNIREVMEVFPCLRFQPKRGFVSVRRKKSRAGDRGEAWMTDWRLCHKQPSPASHLPGVRGQVRVSVRRARSRIPARFPLCRSAQSSSVHLAAFFAADLLLLDVLDPTELPSDETSLGRRIVGVCRGFRSTCLTSSTAR
jgi:hypothetical protein